ncbi:peroxiredoxin family protein [Oceanobacillus sp. CAU 1775]
MVKKLLPLFLLIGLVAWGVYDYTQSSSGSLENPNEEDQTYASSPKDKIGELENGTSEMVIGIEEGNLAPDFSLQTLQGESAKLSDFRGQNVMVNFWATWCPPCRAEMPHMQSYYAKHKEDDFTILAVNMTTTESKQERIGQFIDELDITFPILLDLENEAASNYQVMVYPTSYFIDKNGVIKFKVPGAINEEIIEKLVVQMNK